VLVEVAPSGDRREGRPDTAATHDQDLHGRGV
jgi:hypothetical protein